MFPPPSPPDGKEPMDELFGISAGTEPMDELLEIVGVFVDVIGELLFNDRPHRCLLDEVDFAILVLVPEFVTLCPRSRAQPPWDAT
jgi:hypothetical protein